MFSNLHDYRISRFFFVHCTKWRNSDFTPLSHTHDPVFLNSPRRSPKAKKLSKDRGGICGSDPLHGGFSGLKYNLCSYHHATSSTASIIWYSHFLLSCCKHFQHALLKTFFHNMAMTTLIEHARTFLYMLEHLTPPIYWICVSTPYTPTRPLSSWNWSKPHKKRTFTTSIHVYI